MISALQIVLESRPLERIAADVAIAGIFSDERPLRGGAGRVDWRLCGWLSTLLRDQRVRGTAGEVLLVPSPGRLAAPRVLLFGLGPREEYRPANLATVMSEITERCVELAASRIALSPPGVADDDFPRHAESFLSGLTAPLSALHVDLKLTLPLPDEERLAAARALDQVPRTAIAKGVEVTLPKLGDLLEEQARQRRPGVVRPGDPFQAADRADSPRGKTAIRPAPGAAFPR